MLIGSKQEETPGTVKEGEWPAEKPGFGGNGQDSHSPCLQPLAGTLRDGDQGSEAEDV